MRIGIDASCWSNRRGFGRFTRELLGAMAALRTDDEFVLFVDRQTADESEFPAGWRVVVARTREAPTRAAAARGRRSIGDMWAMRRAVARERLDVVFFPAVYTYFPTAGRVACVVTFHDVIAETLPHLVFENRRTRWFWNLKCRAAVRRSALLLTVSQASRDGLVRVFNVPPERVRVISEAPSACFRPVERENGVHAGVLRRYGLRPGERYVLYVGGISPHKNLDTLIDAFAKLADETELADVRLVMVGDYAKDVFRTCYGQLRARIAQRGIDGRALFAGYVGDDDLPHLYAAAQALVLPSYLEGFGLPAAEAMACGTPVVASDAGSLPEVLGGAGELFDPHEAGSIASALRDVLRDEGKRAALAERSIARAREFTWERSARQALAVLHEAAGRPAGGG